MKQALLIIISIFFYVHSFAFVTQSNWRWRNNNGSETSASWKASQNQPIIIKSIDSTYRLRIQMQNNTGGDKSINTNLMYASAPNGPWRYITNFDGNNAFRISNKNNYVTDLQSTTQQITGSTDVYTPGKLFVKTNELDVTLANGTTSEYEYCIQPTTNIQANTTYYFQIPGNDYPVVLPSLTTSANINTKKKLITNGSFEDSLKDWTFVVNAPAAATTSLPDSVHQDGTKSLVVAVTKTGVPSAVRLTHKAFALTVGKTYMVRFWAYAKNNSAKMQLALKGNKTLTYDYKFYTGWREYQFAFKAAQPNVTLNLLFQTATVYTVDKVEILDDSNAEVDVPMNYMWQNNRPENEYSWLSADGENSQPLPDGRTVWTFSDGWYGYNDTTTNSMSTNRLLRNTFVTQSQPRPNGILHTITGGTAEQPEPLMNAPDKRGYDNFFWPRDLTIENDSLKILLPEVIQWKSGDPLTNGKRQAVGVFSLPDLQLRSIKWMTFLDSVPNYYVALCKADDGYTYAYSSHAISSYENHAIVARFPTGQLSATTPWQYLTDAGWTNNQQNSKEIANVELFSVTRLGVNNYMSLFLNPLSDKVEVLYAQNPVGPWVGRSIVGQVDAQTDHLAYFGLMHEETANNGVYTFSFSNIGDIGHMLDDKTVYWPTYLKGDLKSLSPFNDGVLAVKLLSFTAQKDGEQTIQNWKTVTETNNDQFIVQRSADGKNNWINIAVVKSKGNSMQNQSYTSHDVQPLNGDNYYRLAQVDKDGTTNVSETRLVHMDLIKATAKIFPNPSHSDINFSLENYSGNSVKVQLSNIDGKLLFNQEIPVQSNGSYKLPLSQKPAAGIYTLVIKGDDLNQSEKIVIQ